MGRLLLMLVLSLPGLSVQARMYQWTDPDTGNPQLSGKPPHWYRGDEPGPRTYVIDNGKVIDDTAVEVPAARRQQLREEAFLRAEQDEAAVRAKLEEAQRMKAGREEAEDIAAAAATPAPTVAPAAPEPAAPTAEDQAAAEVEAMRALVEQWEKVRSESAKQIVHD